MEGGSGADTHPLGSSILILVRVELRVHLHLPDVPRLLPDLV
jgi:hypothetical protein